MRCRRRASGAWTLIVLVAGTILVVSPAAGDVPPTLGAVNTFSSSVPAWTTVRIPAGARMDFGCLDDQGITMTGGGRAFAFYMMKPKATGAFESATFIRYPAEAGSQVFGCAPDLTPGLWRVYVLPDGAAGTVVLRLKGVAGSVSLTPTTPADYHFEMLPATPFSDYPNMYSAGTGPHSLRSRGMVLGGYWFAERNAVASDTGACFWEGEPPVSQIAYSPECLDADWGASAVFVGPFLGGGETIGSGAVEGIGAGPWSIGTYYLGGTVERAVSFGMWLGWD